MTGPDFSSFGRRIDKTYEIIGRSLEPLYPVVEFLGVTMLEHHWTAVRTCIPGNYHGSATKSMNGKEQG